MENDKITSALNVTTISTEPLITDIFRYPYWSAIEGLRFLVGIFENSRSDDDICSLKTLGNIEYSDPADTEIIDAFFERYERLERIWKHSNKKDKYTRGYFFKWARQHQDICRISWLKDAERKGFVRPEEPVLAEEENAAVEAVKSDLPDSERASLLKIVAALSICGYKYPNRAAQAEMLRDFQICGVGVTQNTLRKYLKEAEQYMPAPPRQP